MSLQNFLLPRGVNKQGVTETDAVRTLSALPGIQSFLLNKYNAQSSYEVAELQNMFIWTQIASQISHTPRRFRLHVTTFSHGATRLAVHLRQYDNFIYPDV